MRILLVEDESSAARMIAKGLRAPDSGYRSLAGSQSVMLGR